MELIVQPLLEMMDKNSFSVTLSPVGESDCVSCVSSKPLATNLNLGSSSLPFSVQTHLADKAY